MMPRWVSAFGYAPVFAPKRLATLGLLALSVVAPSLVTLGLASAPAYGFESAATPPTAVGGKGFFSDCPANPPSDCRALASVKPRCTVFVPDEVIENCRNQGYDPPLNWRPRGGFNGGLAGTTLRAGGCPVKGDCSTYDQTRRNPDEARDVGPRFSFPAWIVGLIPPGAILPSPPSGGGGSGGGGSGGGGSGGGGSIPPVTGTPSEGDGVGGGGVDEKGCTSEIATQPLRSNGSMVLACGGSVPVAGEKITLSEGVRVRNVTNNSCTMNSFLRFDPCTGQRIAINRSRMKLLLSPSYEPITTRNSDGKTMLVAPEGTVGLLNNEAAVEVEFGKSVALPAGGVVQHPETKKSYSFPTASLITVSSSGELTLPDGTKATFPRTPSDKPFITVKPNGMVMIPRGAEIPVNAAAQFSVPTGTLRTAQASVAMPFNTALALPNGGSIIDPRGEKNLRIFAPNSTARVAANGAVTLPEVNETVTFAKQPVRINIRQPVQTIPFGSSYTATQGGSLLHPYTGDRITFRPGAVITISGQGELTLPNGKKVQFPTGFPVNFTINAPLPPSPTPPTTPGN